MCVPGFVLFFLLEHTPNLALHLTFNLSFLSFSLYYGGLFISAFPNFMDGHVGEDFFVFVFLFACHVGVVGV